MKVSGTPQTKSITFKTRDVADQKQIYQWWMAANDKELCDQLLSTVAFLKESQNFRQRQAAIYARLYGNMSLFSFIGSNMSKMDQQTGLPADRPTFNLIQSAADTLISRITQSRPAPVFLTDNSNYKERKLAKQLNSFILGEFYQTKTYDKAATMLRDALVMGTGCLKLYETEDKKVGLERVLLTELFVDPNESIYGEPRQIFQIKLVDRKVLMGWAPKFKKTIEMAGNAYPDNSADSSKTVSDLVMVVEGWHLPSFKDAGDGRHTIACSAGIIYNEEYTKDKFPFTFLHYSSRLLGFWAQGLAEQLMGTQLEINSLLFTISRAIKLVGVPRVFVEEGSKVMGAAFTNDVGAIIKYRGTKPIYEVAPCVPQEMYAQLDRLIERGYQQCGVSAMQASSQKPAGLNSGEAIRSYDDISTDRMAFFAKLYDNVFVDLAYAIVDLAKDIAERDGSYRTVYPNKDGTKEIDLPKMSLINDPFIIQCFNQSSLPKDPAGRMQKITEMVQAGMITIKEGRRLLDYPDLDQIEKLANASEERIFQILDKIVEDGKYTPPDPFMDLQLANDLCVQYYNLYTSASLEESKAEMLRNFFTQVQSLKQAAMPPVPPQMPQGASPNAAPQPLAQSPLVPNGNIAGAQ
jgi:hypothetical protein